MLAASEKRGVASRKAEPGRKAAVPQARGATSTRARAAAKPFVTRNCQATQVIEHHPEARELG